MKYRVGLACAVSAAALVAIPLPARAANVDDASNILRAGDCLVVGATRPAAALQSSSGRFALVLTRRDLMIHNEVLLTSSSAAGYTTWRRAASHVPAGAVRLCMQRNGNLVLRSDGVAAWSSRTAGTGAHNYAVLRDGGSLVVRTAAGRPVWSSRTTAVLLTAGDRLLSGRSLRNVTNPHAVTRLTMRASGDLVLTRGTTTMWRTDTHVEGSYLTVLLHGQLALHGPAGRLIWRSTAVGSKPLLTVAGLGRITLESFASGRCWVRPGGACG